jgi:hypothetical protein
VIEFILVLAAVVDLALAALLIGVSGFVFGGGPEGMHGQFWPTAGWTVMLIGCLAMPVAGFLLHRRKKSGVGVLLAWLPAAAALVAVALPAPY